LSQPHWHLSCSKHGRIANNERTSKDARSKIVPDLGPALIDPEARARLV
jgi:hypothetical protein